MLDNIKQKKNFGKMGGIKKHLKIFITSSINEIVG